MFGMDRVAARTGSFGLAAMLAAGTVTGSPVQDPREGPLPEDPEDDVSLLAPSWTELSHEDEEIAIDRLAALEEADRDAVIQRCLDEVASCGARQVALVAAWNEQAGPRGSLPAPTVFSAHDAKVFRGGPKRKLIGPSSSLFRGIRDGVGEPPRERWIRHVRYEFATGTIVAIPAHQRDPLDIVRNLVRGIAPDTDRSIAALLARLDRAGSVREEADFFAHLYSDRDGNAYAGITLFDVWANELSLEVPDVDSRAFGLKIWGEDEMPLPLTKKDHGIWYPRMAKSLGKLRRRMFATRALAEVWFDADPLMPPGYEENAELLNAVIAREGEDGDAVAGALEEHGRNFLIVMQSDARVLGNSFWDPGWDRRQDLREGRALIQNVTLSVLRDVGVYP